MPAEVENIRICADSALPTTQVKEQSSAIADRYFILVVISSVWMTMLYSPDIDPLRVYYGTNTRPAGLLVGARLAITCSPRRASLASARAIHES